MDYDENDFQSQNFQLVGEESKFPPNLQSFSLPKFDLDEHLQAHLRFDSLVDTDVLLDIHGQDNNWIEDFSSGTSAIEFSSSAANNCAILRHNNVWSEATSSESVEMLLKSVGEDEMNDKETIAMESDTQNILSGMLDQMNPALGEVDDNSITGNIRQDDQSVPPDISQGHLFGQDKGASEVASQSPDSITCSRIQEDPSSVSITGALTSHRVSNTPILSEQVRVKCHAAEELSLLLDDAPEEKSHMLIDATGSEHLLEGHEVETHLCSGESDPSNDSLVMMAEGCNVTGFADNSDGLLEAIAYRVKALNNDSKVGGRSSTQAEKVNLLEAEETYCVAISKDDTVNQMISDDKKGRVNTSEMTLECYSSTHMISKTQLKETKDENTTEINPCNLDSRTPEPSFVEKGFEAEVAEESGSKLILSDNVMLGESFSTDLCGNVGVQISFSAPSKLHMAAESSNVHTSYLEISDGEQHAGSSITPDATNLSNDDIAFTGNAAAAVSDGQICDNVGVSSVLSTKKLTTDGLGNTNPASIGVGLPSIKENTDNCKLNPDGSLVENEVREQKEVTSPNMPAPDSISADMKEVQIIGTSSVSITGALTSHRVSNTPVLSEQVRVKCHAAEELSLLLDDAPEEKSHMLIDATGSEHLLEGHEVETHLCSGESDPSNDSLVMMAEGCNVTGFADNSDGLLEAIAYRVKALNNDSKVGGRSSTQAEKVNLLEAEETYCVAISKDDTVNQMISDDKKGRVNTSEMTLECYSSTHMISNTQLKETKDENTTEINPCNLDSRTPEPSFVEKGFEAEVAEESGSKLILSDNVMLGESFSTDLCGNVGVQISFSAPSKLHMAAESSNVHTSYLEISDGEQHAGSSITPDATNLSNDDIAFTGNAAAAVSDGQICDNVGVSSVLSTKKLTTDGLGNTNPASIGVGLPSIKENTDNCKLNPDGSLVENEVREQKEVTSPNMPAPDSISADMKEVQIIGTSSVSVLNGDSDAQFSNEPVGMSDPVVTDPSPPREMTQAVPGVEETIESHQSRDTTTKNVEPEPKKGVISRQLSLEIIQSDEKETKILANCSLAKSGDKVDNRPLAEPDVGEISPLNSMAKPQSTTMMHPLSYVENTYVSRSELQADKPITDEDGTMIGENLVIHDSATNGKGKSERSEASSSEDKDTIFWELPSHGEELVPPEPLPSVENTSAAPVNVSTNMSTTMSGRKEEALFSAIGTSKPSLSELRCGSPTVISCTGTSQDETEGGNVDKAKSTNLDSKASTASEDDRSFTFEVGRLEEQSEKDSGNQWKSFSSVQSSEPHKNSKEKSQGRRLESEGKHHGVTAETVEDKTTDATRSPNDKLTTPRGKAAKRMTMRKKPVDSIGYSCTTSSAITTPVGTVSSGLRLEEIKTGPRIKMSRSPIIQTSSLPDLNSSTSATSLAHQPFTDLQQVQLRAQIFVYGSLIQSIPPDEACMQSAFGETDGGRSSWESVWYKSVERYQSQKSPVNLETPLHSDSAVRAPELETKCISQQSKSVSASASKSVGKSIAPSILNSPPPLASPLWNMSSHDGLHSSLPRGAQLDFNRALSPLHPYQSSQTRLYPSISTPWLPQSPRPGPWAIPAPTPALKASTQYSTVPVVETAMRDLAMPQAPSMQLVSPSSLLPTSSLSIIPPASAVRLETQKQTSSAENNKKTCGVQKPRKRKKAAVTEDFADTTPISQSMMEPASAIANKIPPSTLQGLPSSANTAAEVASETIVSTSAHISPTQLQIIATGDTEQKAIFSEEMVNRIEQAKLQAEDAAATAASVVSHSQGMWNQLAAQKNSGLVIEVEEKLVSAAAAAAVAASVAKAAAAAAKAALDAALQAKRMAEEALESAKTGSLTQSSEASFDGTKNLVNLTPGSILKGKDKINGSSSIISAAREAARRRVEAASAATKRAENLDAIMKAAELAAEAVSQVGTIIAMGDPLSFTLNELVEAGLEGSWKAYRSTTEKINNASNLLGEEYRDLDQRNHHSEQTPIPNNEKRETVVKDGMVHDGHSVPSEDNCQGVVSGVGSPSTIPSNSREGVHLLSNLTENAIQKGSLVEVISDEDGLRGGWFSARVIDVKDNKAYVFYNNLLSDDGSGQLKEWISLDSETNGAPRVRIAHPLIVTKSDGTRKRRREAVGNYVWAVGDKVDAWMRDGWWEGIIKEKSQVDETKLTVHFPAGGDSSLVRAWDLRPSLTWKDGQWIELSRAKETMLQSQGDTPREKRQKFGLDGRGVRIPSKRIPPEDSSKAEDLRPLNLLAKDMIFSVGKNASEHVNSDSLKGKRTTGLQKEGSRVVFGVPKPGKKRKFMEVSKHYDSDKTDKTRSEKDSLKFAKYLMPQASRPWRNTSKMDSKGIRGGLSKPAGARPLKSQTTHAKSMTEMNNPSVTNVSASNGDKSGHGYSSNMRAASSNEENYLDKNPMEVVSFPSSVATTESLVAVPTVQPLTTVHPSKKKSCSAVEADKGVKRSFTPAVDKTSRSEKKPSDDTGKEVPDSTERRRSNRRIQPTSRLLEGLQSSLIMTKIPSFSHEKGSKTLHRSSSSRGTRG